MIWNNPLNLYDQAIPSKQTKLFMGPEIKK